MKHFFMSGKVKRISFLTVFVCLFALLMDGLPVLAAADRPASSDNSMQQDLDELYRYDDDSDDWYSGGSSIQYRNFGRRNSSMIVSTSTSERDHSTVQDLEDAINRAKPNTVSKIKSIDKGKITKLVLNTSLIGISLEATDKDQFVLDYVGVSDQSMFTVSTKAEGSTLTVTANGIKKNKRYYINTNSDKRVNTVRISVPHNVTVQINDTSGNILVSNLSSNVSGSTKNGLIKLTGENITYDAELSCTTGDIIASASSISGSMELSATSGDVNIYADTVSGRSILDCESGDVFISAKTVTGDTAMNCESGDVHYKVTNVKAPTKLTCKSGDIEASVGTLYKNFKLVVSSGDAELRFSKSPRNLTYKGSDNSDIELPRGWRDGYKIGNGTPVLTVECGSGDVEIDIR